MPAAAVHLQREQLLRDRMRKRGFQGVLDIVTRARTKIRRVEGGGGARARV